MIVARNREGLSACWIRLMNRPRVMCLGILYVHKAGDSQDSGRSSPEGHRLLTQWLFSSSHNRLDFRTMGTHISHCSKVERLKTRLR